MQKIVHEHEFLLILFTIRHNLWVTAMSPKERIVKEFLLYTNRNYEFSNKSQIKNYRCVK